MNKLILVIVLIFFWSCKDQTIEKKTNQNIETQYDFQPIQIKKISGINDWSEILVFEEELIKLNPNQFSTDGDLTYLMNHLNAVIDSYPKDLDDLSIKSRLKVIETHVLMLNQSIMDSEKLQYGAKINDIRNAYNTFVAQVTFLINKRKDYLEYEDYN